MLVLPILDVDQKHQKMGFISQLKLFLSFLDGGFQKDFK